MRAAIYTRYGPPDVVGIGNVDKPVPKQDQVLVRVHAASVNPIDWHFMRGTPYFIRIMTGLMRPKERLGVDVAGTVEGLGTNVRGFKTGDAVVGLCRGAFAEYVCVSDAALAIKPPAVKFEQAAAIPLAGLTALQGLRDAGQLQRGQNALINGAAGGVGTFAVQIAKAMGARVTGVCSSRNVDVVRSLGADRVIDYAQENFTAGDERFDVILDCIGNHPISSCRHVLTATGRYVGVGGPTGRWMIGAVARLLIANALSRFTSRKVATMLTKASKNDLATIRELIESGRVTPVVDRRYSLNDLSQAIRYLEAGHARGKVVIEISR
jgi:NADPH:quinone reductase-like Zn-dependent oxidoreductase